MPDIDDFAKVVGNWAELHPRICAAYIFGSRVKGTHRNDSDLDVAIMLLNPQGKPGNFSDWASLANELRNSLEPLLNVKLDLTQYENPIETPIVHNALLAASELVYSMGPNYAIKGTSV
jgi:predicted nucleotidyltransferase